MTNQELYNKALKTIEDLFNDKSVSKEEAKDNLNGLIEEIQIMIQSLEDEEEE